MKTAENKNVMNGPLSGSYLRRGNSAGYLVMPDGSAFSRDSSITGLNNIAAVIAPSGGGKTSVTGVTNIVESNSSLIISDPKGTLYRNTRRILEEMGYATYCIDLTHPERSAGYNPLDYIRSTQDIRRLAHAIVFSDEQKQNTRDPYWENNADSMLCALIGWVMEADIPPERKNFSTVVEMAFSLSAPESTSVRARMPVYKDFKALKLEHPRSWACRMFSSFMELGEKTLSCIISTLTGILTAFDSEELNCLFRRSDFSFRSIGTQKTAVFMIVSDSDRSCDMTANLFYTQAMNELCDFADNECPDGRLPVPVTFVLDDFATNCRIHNFENSISNIRARNISAILMLQSVRQLYAGYGESAQTILNNCDTVIFMGANSYEDASYFSVRANVPLSEMMEMPLYSSWIFRRSAPARHVFNIDPRNYLPMVQQRITEEYACFPQPEL